jgi:hypothetical protein
MWVHACRIAKPRFQKAVSKSAFHKWGAARVLRCVLSVQNPRNGPGWPKAKQPTTNLTTSRPVESLIRVIRGQKVMIDSDLAALYEVPTKRLNEAVKRNPSRFPANFVFRLAAKEIESLRSQFATFKRRAHAFTEHGVVMLSSVLNSERAIQMSILGRERFRAAARNHRLPQRPGRAYR